MLLPFGDQVAFLTVCSSQFSGIEGNDSLAKTKRPCLRVHGQENRKRMRKSCMHIQAG